MDFIKLPPEVERINQQLIDHFGLDTSTGQAIWRVVWSNDQFEKRLMDVTNEGLQLLYPEVREVPKYRQWIPNKWVLERLVLIPDVNVKELPTTKLSYEPMFPFETKTGEALPPNFEAAKFVIDTVYAAQGKSSLNKYVDESESNETKQKRIDMLQEAIFGDETAVSDHLSRQTGVVIANNDYQIKES